MFVFEWTDSIINFKHPNRIIGPKMWSTMTTQRVGHTWTEIPIAIFKKKQKDFVSLLFLRSNRVTTEVVCLVEGCMSYVILIICARCPAVYGTHSWRFVRESRTITSTGFTTMPRHLLAHVGGAKRYTFIWNYRIKCRQVLQQVVCHNAWVRVFLSWYLKNLRAKIFSFWVLIRGSLGPSLPRGPRGGRDPY